MVRHKVKSYISNRRLHFF